MSDATATDMTNIETTYKNDVISDFRLAIESREASLIGRREVLTGKAKFGIFGDGKEVAQIAWAKAFKNGDFRSGYYRDQTFMMAIGQLTTKEFFASLYANTDLEKEPASGGRQMNGHFATRSLDENGNWKDLTAQKNSSADISPTAGQMPRLLGLAQASRYFKAHNDESIQQNFSNNGAEVAWGTIGNASTSEGLFFETFNAAGVLQVPMVISVWDDEYGISVHAKYQTTKENISEILAGFQRDEKPGYEIIVVKGWDYVALIDAYERAGKIAREEHVPVLIHVVEMTQPQGHSTSGSHERYKSPERLQWEKEYDCIAQMKKWMIDVGIVSEEEANDIEKEAKKTARQGKAEAWNEFIGTIKAERDEAVGLLENLQNETGDQSLGANELKGIAEPVRKDYMSALRKAARKHPTADTTGSINAWLEDMFALRHDDYSSHLYAENERSALKVEEVRPSYDDNAEDVDGRIVLRDNFDRILSEDGRVMIFGEDSGKIGDVNQGLEGLQEKHGEHRVQDTGIREATIMGQGIGLAMRGLRPIAEIQYLDYLLYCQQIMSDDLATVRYRSRGGQMAPTIIRTRGHRLEGIWHSGSPLGTILNSMRGIYVLVPRNMTKAAGFYNTMLESDDPALIIECLNGYRLKEKLPNNLGDIRTPLGIPEVINEGSDLTVVTYGSNCRIALEAAAELETMGINIEIIDVQTLLPFDVNHQIVEHLKNTNRVIFFDEDVPGGASAYMMQQVLEEQGGYQYLDAKPRTLCAKAHRPAYGTDGDYFSKPSADDLVDMVLDMVKE